LALAWLLASGAGASAQSIYPQCPKPPGGTIAADGSVWDENSERVLGPNGGPVRCFHVSAGDGYTMMADGKRIYTFGFGSLYGVDDADVMTAGLLGAESPAPTLVVDQGDEVFLTVSNVGMAIRPDLFDPHTIHWHGFPQASSIFDGVPDASISISMGASLTYYYNVKEEGTYIYHCHVEATEHMQMGMYGNLYVQAAQDKSPVPINGYTRFAYNDGTGATGYDEDYPILLHAFDPHFHDLHEAVQPLPFAEMEDRYYLINGRGYPDTVASATGSDAPVVVGAPKSHSQRVSSLIEAQPGDHILLRIASLNITGIDTLATAGIPMHVVGKDARHLVSPEGDPLYYYTNSLTLGGGETYDVILEIPPGGSGQTYFLYSANQQRLTNDEPNFAWDGGGFQTGGMLTEIRVASNNY